MVVQLWPLSIVLAAHSAGRVVPLAGESRRTWAKAIALGHLSFQMLRHWLSR